MGDDGFSVDGPETLRGALLLLVLGLAVGGYGVYDYVQQTDAVRNSVEVQATIVEVGVETDSSGSSRSVNVDYEPTVRFTYEYDGSSYTGSKLYPAAISSDHDTRSAAESELDGYAEGETVTAYVTPSDPDDAFLKNQTTNAPIFAGLIGAVMAGAGGVSAVWNYRDSQRPSFPPET